MSYVYGPIPSRRLGKSLGVDPIPLKTCNWNCVYCQLGRSVPLVNRRAEYIPRAEILADVAAALAAHHPGDIDYISFVGSGEPTLHSGLGWLIRQVKALTNIPVAVITNGALLYRAAVRRELLAADVVMPTLSAGNAALYKQIHRPHPALTFDRLVNGLAAFRTQYAGQIWIEVMLLNAVNDSDAALHELAAVLERVQPDQVHITLPERPPAEPWVGPPDSDGLMRATAILGRKAIIVPPTGTAFDLSGHASVLDAVLAIITRHPMSETQIRAAVMQQEPTAAATILADLEHCGGAELVIRHGERFWAAAEAVFPNHASLPPTFKPITDSGNMSLAQEVTEMPGHR